MVFQSGEESRSSPTIPSFLLKKPPMLDVSSLEHREEPDALQRTPSKASPQVHVL